MFIDNFQWLCAQQGVADTYVTRKLGIGGSTYDNWKNGGKPQNATKKKIADYFGISVDELMSEKLKQPTANNDDELNELLQACKDRSDLRMMFQTFKDAKTSDVLKVIADYQKMRGD